MAKEAILIVNKFTKVATHEQTVKLVDIGLLELLCDALWDSDVQFVINLLETIENVLIVGVNNHRKCFSDKLHAIGGVLKLEQLQDSNNDKIYKKSLRILEKFFETEEL